MKRAQKYAAYAAGAYAIATAVGMARVGAQFTLQNFVDFALDPMLVARAALGGPQAVAEAEVATTNALAASAGA